MYLQHLFKYERRDHERYHNNRDDWGYDIKVVDGSIVVNHKNRPQSKHPQYNSKS